MLERLKRALVASFVGAIALARTGPVRFPDLPGVDTLRLFVKVILQASNLTNSNAF